VHPSVLDLNVLLNRQLYNTRNIEFVSTVPEGKNFLGACADEQCAEFAALAKFSEEVGQDPSRFVTTSDVVEATTLGYSFSDATPSMSIAAYMRCRKKFGNGAAFKKLSPPNVDVFPTLARRMVEFARPR
tara:strand:- start:1284 stop:1673 length:390 start_codon:yes stop_codon:yes gene_type:complete